MTNEDEIIEIERALGALLDAIEKHGGTKKRRGPGDRLEVFSLEQLVALPRLYDLYKDPVAIALRRAIKSLGERLYEIVGNTNDMGKIADRVAARNEAKWDKRINIIDKWWNGIGSGNDIWVA